ncbi:haloacid dehalogenase [Pilimelia anulata]|uniref:Haloacid dehalogenase n=1 Tax=Pilimelia anulata TaxID=53371 RepID=A0A8J3AZ92_9ACTN|nr:haloacid dehalogenase-like hydrolase [Pilimelia anulata]GGJ78318.1 haloacid dehalogenase [Pilimelia anulata]
MTGQRTALILWDIDHTLVSIGGLSRRIYERAFREVTGQPLGELADMTGRTECAILTDTLDMHGIHATSELLDACYRALAVAAEDLRDEIRGSGRVLPGAPGALAGLAAVAQQTVVTGNIRPIAEIKLGALDLAEHINFAIGGYGSDGQYREPLVRLACARANEQLGTSFAAQQVVVIGDTPLDIEAARAAGVHSIGVATGSSSVEALEAVQSSAVLPDLSDSDRLLRVVLELTA